MTQQRGDADESRVGRHPRLTPVELGSNATDWRSRLRMHLRNPPMRTVFLIVLVIIAVPSLIVMPKVTSVARENWANVQLARERHFVNVTAASWIYPFLRRQAERMQEADVPIEWRGVSFQNGPCFPEHMEQLPTGKYSYAIQTACESLHEIQTKYAADCARTANCDIPESAVVELQIVLDRLKVAFSDANLVQEVEGDGGQSRSR